MNYTMNEGLCAPLQKLSRVTRIAYHITKIKWSADFNNIFLKWITSSVKVLSKLDTKITHKLLLKEPDSYMVHMLGNHRILFECG